MKEISTAKILSNIGRKAYLYEENIPNTLPEDTIISEKETKERNAELVREFNLRICNRNVHAREEQQRLTQNLRHDTVRAIAREYNLSEKQANIIESFAYTSFYITNQTGYIQEVNRFARMVNLVIDAGE